MSGPGPGAHLSATPLTTKGGGRPPHAQDRNWALGDREPAGRTAVPPPSLRPFPEGPRVKSRVGDPTPHPPPGQAPL